MRCLRWSPWLVPFTFAACSSVPPTVCDTNSARQLGVSLAMRGVAPDYRAGASCPPAAEFRKTLDEGYAEGRAR